MVTRQEGERGRIERSRDVESGVLLDMLDPSFSRSARILFGNLQARCRTTQANRTPGSEELVVAAVAALPGRAQPPSSSLCSTSLGRGVKAQDKPPTHLQSRAYTVLLRMGKGIVWFSWVLSGLHCEFYSSACQGPGLPSERFRIERGDEGSDNLHTGKRQAEWRQSQGAAWSRRH